MSALAGRDAASRTSETRAGAGGFCGDAAREDAAGGRGRGRALREDCTRPTTGSSCGCAPPTTRLRGDAGGDGRRDVPKAVAPPLPRFRRAVLDAARHAEFVPFVQTSFAVAVERTSLDVKIETNANANDANDASADANADANAGVHPDVVCVYNRVKPAASRDYSIKIVSSTRAHTHAGSDETCVFVSTWTEDTSEEARTKKRRDTSAAQPRIDTRAEPPRRIRTVPRPPLAHATSAPRVPGWLVDVANALRPGRAEGVRETRAKRRVRGGGRGELPKCTRRASTERDVRVRFFSRRNDIFGAFGAFRTVAQRVTSIEETEIHVVSGRATRGPLLNTHTELRI